MYKRQTQDIYYRALTTYLVNNSQFRDLRVSLIQAATDLNGAGSNEITVIANAFDEVGISGPSTGNGNESGGETTVEVDANPGDDFVIFTDDAKSSLSLADGDGNILASPLSTTPVLSKPSITDDGRSIVFVAADKTIHLITIEDNGEIFEQVIQDQPIWRNVAVSRDGYRIAALTDQISNTIDVFDFTLQEWKTFELYNPTFTEGITTGEVQFADVIEFDFSGEYVLYDASNALKGDFGENDIEYWDIGFIKVYDNNIDNFEVNVTNNIFKLFSGLPENVSIGNPTFSKNSPNVIAYEYIDNFNTTENNQQIYELRGHNLDNGRENTLFNSLNLHVPNFSRLDDRIIFNNLSGNTFSIAQIELAADKISRANEDAFFFLQEEGGAQLGVWFSDEARQLTATNELEKAVAGFQIAPNPVGKVLQIQFNLEERKDLLIEVYNTLGQRQLSKVIDANIGENYQELDAQGLSAGTYFVALKSEESVVTRKVVKE